jgi:DNA uptake protein ComE-like DNA-binding protein
MPTRRGRSSGPADRATIGAIVLLILLAAASATPSAGGAALSDARLRLDPNSATAGELMLLPGIGPRLSERIIEFRETAVPRPAFQKLADLQRVRGIGPATAERLAPWLRFAGAARADEDAP